MHLQRLEDAGPQRQLEGRVGVGELVTSSRGLPIGDNARAARVDHPHDDGDRVAGLDARTQHLAHLGIGGKGMHRAREREHPGGNEPSCALERLPHAPVSRNSSRLPDGGYCAMMDRS